MIDVGQGPPKLLDPVGGVRGETDGVVQVPLGRFEFGSLLIANRGRRRPAGHEPDRMAAVPLDVHLAFQHPTLLEGDERLAHGGGTFAESVADQAPEALAAIGPQFAALAGDVLEDPPAQGRGANGVERGLDRSSISVHAPCLPTTPFGVTRKLPECHPTPSAAVHFD